MKMLRIFYFGFSDRCSISEIRIPVYNTAGLLRDDVVGSKWSLEPPCRFAHWYHCCPGTGKKLINTPSRGHPLPPSLIVAPSDLKRDF